MLLVSLLASCSLTHKQIVGATERITIEEAGLTFTARIDTGAKTSSIHATDITLRTDGTHQRISFTTSNRQGESNRIEAELIDVVSVKNAEGSSQRYKVALTVNHHGHQKQIEFTLKDRTHITYPILLGRNWLSGDYVVDVEKLDTTYLQ